ncbi:sensor histidine kinase [Candidatus Venteria ishoeyi]|uniref:sensor histidine kinase n=1 Tax=Candidatus Venteria ishoeyi TaxID=1899563 RepID=UPI0025A63854|nr:sensor histidine kinase [Candidatus Venteria ishoeyi]MDM8548114.1 sensor histidine kinase [Candidatus Venteria ishoeyi]
MRLQQKLFLSISALALLPLLILQFGVVGRNEQILEEQMRQEVLAVLDKLAGELQTLIRGQQSLVQGLAEVPTVREFVASLEESEATPDYFNRAEKLESFFLNYQTVVPPIQGLRVFDSNGNTLVKVKEDHVDKPLNDLPNGRRFVANHGQTGFFQVVAKPLPSDGIGMSNFELGQVKPQDDFCPSMLRYVTPLENRLERAGYLVVNFWGKGLDQLIQKASLQLQKQILMSEISPQNPVRDGVYLYHPDNDMRFGNQTDNNYRLSLDLEKDVWWEITGGNERGDVAGEQTQVFYLKLRPYPERDIQWLLTVETDRKSFLGPIHNVQRTIWTLLVVVFLLTLILARWSAAVLARPLNRFVEMLTRYGNGEKVRCQENRRDEMGAVGKAFNRLIDNLAEAEQKRQQAEAVANQTARLATVGELAAGVAHEINNPLNNMMSLLDIINKEPLPGGVREDLDLLRQENRRCAEVVQGLLDFSRPKPPLIRQVDMLEVVEDSVRLLHKRARTLNIELQIVSAPQGAYVKADPAQIQQVLVNILLNAIHISPPDSSIDIYLKADEKCLECRVEDYGKGVAPQELSKIFQPFYTTKQDRGGTGLGLSVSYAIIMRHNGEIRGELRPGGGLAVCFRLPRWREIDDETKLLEVSDA